MYPLIFIPAFLLIIYTVIILKAPNKKRVLAFILVQGLVWISAVQVFTFIVDRWQATLTAGTIEEHIVSSIPLIFLIFNLAASVLVLRASKLPKLGKIFVGIIVTLALTSLGLKIAYDRTAEYGPEGSNSTGNSCLDFPGSCTKKDTTPKLFITSVPDTSPTRTIQDDVNKVSIDFSKCTEDLRTIHVTYDTTIIETTGKDGDYCLLNYGKKVDSAAWKDRLSTSCRIPISLGKTVLPKDAWGVKLDSLRSYCATV